MYSARFSWFAACLLPCLIVAANATAQNVSCVVEKAPSDPASLAFAQQDYAKAFQLYSDEAGKDATNFKAVAGQVRSLLEQQKVDAAADLAEKASTANPTISILKTALAEVRFRQGRLNDAAVIYQQSLNLDPCLARTHYDVYNLFWVESMRKSAFAQLQTAHQLEPEDPDIHLAWINHLPIQERSRKLAGYLQTATGQPADKRDELLEYAARLRAVLAAKNEGCRLVSTSLVSTKIPFTLLLRDPNHYKGMGFQVKINNKAKALLELDTGSTGILLDKNTARKAGLVPIATDKIEGIGDEKSMSGYWAFADDLRIGSLEFQNCMVEVSNKGSIGDTEGLIGADVFENYHVQLDFPLRQMTLVPLPARPGIVGTAAHSLNSSGVGNAAASSAEGAKSKNGESGSESAAQIQYSDRYISPEMKSWSMFVRIGHQILIPGYLKDNHPRLFLLDSGANISILSVTAAKSVGKVHVDDDDQITGLSGRVKKIYMADKVDVIFAGLDDPLINVLLMSLDAMSNDSGTEISGIIGLDTLSLLTVDIDYRDGLVHIVYDPKHGMNIGLNAR